MTNSNDDNATAKPRGGRSAGNVALGVTFGLPAGIIFGITMENLAIGISMGIGIGVAYAISIAGTPAKATGEDETTSSG